jgi:hypothetical protein
MIETMERLSMMQMTRCGQRQFRYAVISARSQHSAGNMNDEHTMTTSPAMSQLRNVQSSGSAMMPPPSNGKDAPKVMDEKLIQVRDGRSGYAGSWDMVIASLRTKSRLTRPQVSSLR